MRNEEFRYNDNNKNTLSDWLVAKKLWRNAPKPVFFFNFGSKFFVSEVSKRFKFGKSANFDEFQAVYEGVWCKKWRNICVECGFGGGTIRWLTTGNASSKHSLLVFLARRAHSMSYILYNLSFSLWFPFIFPHSLPISASFSLWLAVKNVQNLHNLPLIFYFFIDFTKHFCLFLCKICSFPPQVLLEKEAIKWVILMFWNLFSLFLEDFFNGNFI